MAPILTSYAHVSSTKADCEATMKRLRLRIVTKLEAANAKTGVSGGYTAKVSVKDRGGLEQSLIPVDIIESATVTKPVETLRVTSSKDTTATNQQYTMLRKETHMMENALAKQEIEVLGMEIGHSIRMNRYVRLARGGPWIDEIDGDGSKYVLGAPRCEALESELAKNPSSARRTYEVSVDPDYEVNDMNSGRLFEQDYGPLKWLRETYVAAFCEAAAAMAKRYGVKIDVYVVERVPSKGKRHSREEEVRREWRGSKLVRRTAFVRRLRKVS